MSERVNDPRLQLIERTTEGDLQLKPGVDILDADGNPLVSEQPEAGEHVLRVKYLQIKADFFDTPISSLTSGSQLVDVNGAGDPDTNVTGLETEGTPGEQTVNVGGDKVGGSATGLSNAVDSSGTQVVDVGGVGDDPDPTLMLANYNGTDAATTTDDEVAGVTHTLTGDAELDTAQQQFGTASLLFPTSGDNDAVAGIAGFDPAAWTLEGWFRVAGATAILVIELLQADDDQSVLLNLNVSAGTFGVILSDTDESSFFSTAPAFAPSNDTWYHFALSVSSTSVEGYFNGTRIINGDPMSGVVGVVTKANIGTFATVDTWLDSPRLSNGKLYTGATITPPASEPQTGLPATGLADDTTIYECVVTVDGGTPQAVTLLGQDAQEYPDLITALNADTVGATWSIDGNGNLLLTSDSSGLTSTIDISDDDLFSSLTDFVDIELAVDGTAEVSYEASITIDGVGPEIIAVVGNAAQTYTELLAEIEATIDPLGAAVELAGGNLRFVSDLPLATSSISLVDDTLFAALTGFVAINAAIPGQNAPDYTASVVVDGLPADPIVVNGEDAETYADLLFELQADSPNATWSIDGNGNLLLTSDSSGAGSTIAITDGTLFAALTDFVAIDPAVAGTDEVTSVGVSFGLMDPNAVFVHAAVSVTDAFNPGTSISWDVNIGELDNSGETLVNNIPHTGGTVLSTTVGLFDRVVGEFDGIGELWIEYVLTGSPPTAGSADVILQYFIAPPKE